MGIKKIQYIPASKLLTETKDKYGIKDGEFAQLRITNPNSNQNIEIRRVKSPIDELRKSFKKKELQNFEL